jgi:hypothetical protein
MRREKRDHATPKSAAHKTATSSIPSKNDKFFSPLPLEVTRKTKGL